jgi:hypothetical protein
MMIAIRSTLSNARRLLPVRMVVLLPLMLAILAACSPGSGGAPGY